MGGMFSFRQKEIITGRAVMEKSPSIGKQREEITFQANEIGKDRRSEK